MIRDGYNEEEMRLNLDLLQEKRETTNVREARYKIKMEQCYNKKVDPSCFRPGEFVFRRNESDHKSSKEISQGPLEAENEGAFPEEGLHIRYGMAKIVRNLLDKK
nr:reverse transcriptase domain-containing protein [Tanacetum cinerariifolium]